MLMYEIWSLGRKPFDGISGHEVHSLGNAIATHAGY